MKKNDVNILIIEDDKSVLDSISEAVKRKGYRAIAVTKPDEAESIVKIKPIHGVICDVMLPGRNGIDLVMRLKENLMEGTGIVFVSGIYKDKAFIAEAIKKTDALDYYTKPLDINALISTVDKKISEYIEAPHVDLHALLSANLTSNRDRRKAVDRVESLCGYDLPFVMCILMDSQSSGHLNIADEDQNIYGITFASGTIAKIDSESSILMAKKILIQHGFISEMELSEVQNKNADIIKSLVDEGLMSPHVPSIVKSETIMTELKKLLPVKSLKINFVLDRKIHAEPDNIDINVFTQSLHDIIMHSMPVEWLKGFYSVWMGHPIRLGPQFADHHQYIALPILKQVEGIIEFFKKESTLEDIIVQCPQFTEEKIYKALHFLMLRRALVFEESKRVKNIDEHVNRLKTMYDELKSKNPIQIFQYFGLGDNPKPVDLARIYKEFAKTHHPDVLTKHVNEDIRKMNHALFAHVTSAYETLSNSDKKEKFLSTIKQQEAELQIKSDDLVTNAAASLTRGRYSEALPMLEEAVKLYESERSLLHYWWVKFKVEGQMTEAEIPEIDRKHKAMSTGMRKTALWIFVKGLIKRYKGDLVSAEADFTRTLEIEENFMDARREIANIKAKKKSDSDTLTGEISAVVKGFFNKGNKKKGA